MPSTRPTPWLLLLIAVVLVPLLPLLVGGGFVVQHDVWVSDPLHANLPYRAFIGAALRNGDLPTWLPGVYSGSPLLAQVEAGVLYPPHLLLYGLLDPLTATNLAFTFDALVAACGAWWLARRYGVSAAGAVLAGLVFAWSGFMVSHLRHFNMHAAAAWLPWVMLATEKVLATKGRRGGPLLALALAIQLAAGHPQVSYITGLLVAGRTLVGLALLDAWRDRVRAALAVGLATGLGIALLAVQHLPVIQFTRASYLAVEPSWAFATAFPFRPADLLVFVSPAAVGSMETYDYQGAQSLPWGNYGYLGLAPLLLALGSLATRRRPAVGWVAAAVVALLVVLGDATPLFEAAWRVLPGMKLFRFPNRFLLVVALAVAIAAAMGLDALLRRVSGRVAALLAGAVVLGTLADLAHNHRPRMPIDSAAAWRDPGPLPAVLRDAGVTGYITVLEEFSIWEEAFHQAQGYAEGTGPYRAAWAIPIGHSGLRMGVETTSGYTRMTHARPAAFWQRYNHSTLAAVHQPPEPSRADPTVTPARRALWARGGVEAVLSLFALDDDRLGLLATAPAGVYRNPDALPRAYLARTWRPVTDLDAAAEWMLETGLDRLDVPAVEGAPPSPTAPDGHRRLDLSSPDSETRILRLPAEHDGGMAVLIESWDEGWRAVIDGVAAEVWVANGYQIGVRVPPNAREITLHYRAPGLTEGMAVSGLSAFSLATWAALAYRRRRG